ncbi:hypothetical protein INT43_000343 [Umbelopsis isabellina]|uniref:MARVEL domain-containing protein n=1 Tax=Mortierella isabellina TaxID=91625 RepID=A0A8H7UMN9_MORIS|nr:hypothetical protein INT43_000343 [Umbelopsis isabellina]
MQALTPFFLVLLSAILFLSAATVLLNAIAFGYFETARQLSSTNEVYVDAVDYQRVPSEQATSRDYVLIVVGTASFLVSMIMLVTKLNHISFCCFTVEWRRRNLPIFIEVSAGIIMLVWWVAMITFILTSYDGFPKCTLIGSNAVTHNLFSGCYLMDGALGASVLATIVWILVIVIAALRTQEPQQSNADSEKRSSHSV